MKVKLFRVLLNKEADRTKFAKPLKFLPKNLQYENALFCLINTKLGGILNDFKETMPAMGEGYTCKCGLAVQDTKLQLVLSSRRVITGGDG